MRFADFFAPVARVFKQRTRRSWVTGERAWVEYGGIGHTELGAFDRALRAAVSKDGRIRKVEVNAHARRVVFFFERGACALSELVSWVEDAERVSGVAQARFDGASEHPSDHEPELRRLVGLIADSLAVSVGVGLAMTPIPAVPFSGSAAALLSLISSVDRHRAGLDKELGREHADVFLDVGTALF
jgi:hypothetical protein